MELYRGDDTDKDRYVCPSDRQLALRAKLRTGWSSTRTPATLEPEEKNAIIAVIKRNEQLETAERLRVGKLVERVEKIKLKAAECGPRCCRLCGQSFGLLGPVKFICDDCQKPVCSKCSIELNAKRPGVRSIWLCKICSETREMWKKTGAWFFKGIPKYELPQVNSIHRSTSVSCKETKPNDCKPIKLDIKCTDSSSEEEEEEDEEDDDAGDGGNHNDHDANVRNLEKNSYGYELYRNDKMISLKEQSNYQTQIDRKHPLYKRQRSFIDIPSNPDWDVNSSTDSLTAAAAVNNKHEISKICCGSISSSRSTSEVSSSESCNNGGGGASLGVSFICNEPPLGWLEIALLYSESDHTLDCSIIRARDLPAMDCTGLADPFCKVNIITEYGMAKQKKWFATKTVHKTKNPEFNERISFFGVEPEELSSSILYVVLLDDDQYGNDFLGTAKICLGPIYSPGSHRMSIPLSSEDQHSLEASLTGAWQYGQILVALCYSIKRRGLVVQIKRCTNLIAKDNNGFSDPFVKIQLKPDSYKHRKYKTNVKWRNLNPIFNEEFCFDVRPNDLDKQSLVLTVWDKDIGKSNDFLGTLIIGATSKGKRLKQWKDCTRLPDYFHEQWHCLSGILQH